jgi:DNA-binding transcriptional LysR family regulator
MLTCVTTLAVSDTDNVSSDVSFRDLQVFLSVATTGSFRATAQRLFVSQPAVSRTIARLEREFGAALLERGPRGAVVTAAGRALAEDARRASALLGSMRADVRDGIRHTIRLGAAATAAGSYLAPFLATWIPAHSGTRIEVVEGGAVALRDRLADRDCDVAIIALPIGDDFEHVSIGHLAVRAHFPQGHPLDTGDSSITIDELVGQPLLVNSSGFLAGRILLAECESSGYSPRIAYRSDNGQALAALAEAGLGVAVFADSVDLRGIDLQSRTVCGRDGEALGFTLAVAWPRRGTPESVREFGIALAMESQRRVGTR